MNSNAVRCGNEIVFVGSYNECLHVLQSLKRHHDEKRKKGDWNALNVPDRDINIVYGFTATMQWCHEINEWWLTIENTQVLLREFELVATKLMLKYVKWETRYKQALLTAPYTFNNIKRTAKRYGIEMPLVPYEQLHILYEVIRNQLLEAWYEMCQIAQDTLSKYIEESNNLLLSTTYRTKRNINIGLDIYDKQPYVSI
jgi:hypothetical protein